MKKFKLQPNPIKYVLFAITVGFCVVSGSSFALADNFAYSVARDGSFGTTDLDSGVTTTLGSTGLTLGGLGSINNVLYGTGFGTNSLYSINISNGSPTLIGTSSVSYDSFGSTPNGLYSFANNDNLYSIDPTTGAPTLIGPTGLSIGSWRGLSTNANSLYYAQDGSLYTLNTTTGAATLLSNSLGASVGEMVEENGTLYGVTLSGGAIDTIDLTTGTANPGPNPNENIWGLSPLSKTPETAPVPEPMTLQLLGTGLLGLAAFRRKI